MKKNQTSRPAIVDFKDYREYLKALFLARKAQNAKFSYEFCAQKLKTAKSYLRQVFDKKIHVNANRIADLCELFHLSAYERQYFIVLLMENLIQEKSLKTYFRGTLKRIRANEELEGIKSYRATKVVEGFQLGDWLSQTIGTMTELKDFKPDAQWIQDRLIEKIALSDLRKALEIMIQKGHLVYQEGRYRESQPYSTGESFETEGHKRHLSGLRKVERVLQASQPVDAPMTFQDGAIAVTKDSYKEITEAYQRFLQEIIILGNKHPEPDRVAYLFHGFFLATKSEA